MLTPPGNSSGSPWGRAERWGRSRRVTSIAWAMCKFTGLPVFSGAAVVIDTVGEVGALLDLGDENARANGVERAGLDEKHVAAMNPRLSGGYLFHFSYYIIL